MIRKLSILTGAALFSLLTAMAQKEPADYVNPLWGLLIMGQLIPVRFVRRNDVGHTSQCVGGCSRK